MTETVSHIALRKINGHDKTDFYKALLTLKHRNTALWNGQAGGKLIKIPTDHDQQVYAFYRQRDTDRVVVLVNLSSQPLDFQLNGADYNGMDTDVFMHEPVTLKPDMAVSLKPWEYRVLTN